MDDSKCLQKNEDVEVMSLEEFKDLGRKNRRNPIGPNPETIYVICHTSGTTGRPKGVEMSHRGLLAGVAGIHTSWTNGYEWKFGKEDTYFSFLSLAHIYEHLMQTLTIYFGGRIGIYDGNISTLIQQIQNVRPSIVSLVPRLLNKLYEAVHDGIAKRGIVARNLFEFAKKTKARELEKGILQYDTFFDKVVFSKLKEMLGGQLKVLTTGGAPVTKEVKTFTRYAYGCPLVEGYGQTECSAAGTLTLPWDTTYGNVGGPAPWAQIKLVDVPEKNCLAKNDEGEVCFRGSALMNGYFNDDDLTRKTIDSEGWLHTGDIGRWLPSGALQIIDRKNEMFKLCQGDFVSPIQIESIYANSPLITQIYVTGNTERSFLVGIVVLDLPKFKEMPEVKAFEGKEEIEKIMERKEVKEAVIADLNKYAKANGLQLIELIRNVHMTLQEFSEENGLVTTTLKNRRKVLEEFFKPQIRKMYEEINDL
uniref:long-chain-fatty-acid--CoA ligase n=1 Tax=Caenorhabditis tropicalis TaxID=1561998 RepID=A0A1I7TU95_9PELO